MAEGNSTLPKPAAGIFGERCALTIGEITNATDNLSMNISFVKSHLSAIQQFLEGGDTADASNAETMSYAARHFVEILEADVKALCERSKQSVDGGQL